MFSGVPEKQSRAWRNLEQLFLATIREIGIGDVLRGNVKLPEQPAEGDNTGGRQRINREIARYRKLNGILYGRLLLMAVANGSLGWESPAVSTVLAHGPVHPETEAHGYEAFQALKTKYEANANIKPWDLE